MALGRNHAFGGAVNGKIYVIGGRTAHAFITVSTNTDIVEEYDPATNMWSGLKAKMPTARSGGGWATYNGRIYVAGGEVSTPEVAGHSERSRCMSLRPTRGISCRLCRCRGTAWPEPSSATDSIS